MDLKEIPKNKELTYLGLTTYRDKNVLFGIKRKDRRQHVYILGKSGTGKSALMFNMIIQNIENGDGVCMVDPHGENVEAILSAIPPHRMKDVVYFNPADTDFHIGFNVLELIDPKYKHLVASGLMGIFTKIWANAWSARMEYILNNAILALLDTPGSTLLGIPRMLVDKDYRQKIITNLKDPVIKAFWVHEYEAWQDKFRNEAIAPIQNKVGQFLSTSIIRNIVGQSQSTINIFDIMNEGKIFLVNVSKGRIGEDNSSLLGGMIITKIQLAAMERVRIPEETRKDFYLYVDEFQNFVTDAFAGILSEARKYRLNLTVAHQYTAQLVTEKNSSVRDAIFGNVGTMIVFRVGADDAEFLEKEFEPEFVPQDIVNLPNFKVYLKLMIDGVSSRPFSAKTLPPMVKSGNKEVEEEVIKSSRDLYCRPREVVEREINDWSGMSIGDENNPGNVEKFPAKCSSCGKETMVPFKPEPGRAVYCKDCIAKIKSGEIKPIGGIKQIKQDETKFYRPLADLGIEFEQKDKNVEAERYPERIDKQITTQNYDKVVPAKKAPIFSTIKKVFTRNPLKEKVTPAKVVKENPGLKEALDKALSENKPAVSEPKINPPAPTSTPAPLPVSLNTLKNDNKEKSSKDRAASAEDMDKLKNIIQTAEISSEKEKVKEVPEDVLRKILE
jgi:CxxC-x17-CxxC domain-containing protein